MAETPTFMALPLELQDRIFREVLGPIHIITVNKLELLRGVCKHFEKLAISMISHYIKHTKLELQALEDETARLGRQLLFGTCRPADYATIIRVGIRDPDMFMTAVNANIQALRIKRSLEIIEKWLAGVRLSGGALLLHTWSDRTTGFDRMDQSAQGYLWTFAAFLIYISE